MTTKLSLTRETVLRLRLRTSLRTGKCLGSAIANTEGGCPAETALGCTATGCQITLTNPCPGVNRPGGK